ncbi:MerR family transcriptional regulator [Streptomyces sp. SYP-A7185]|uniref:MerR family transcriptional regulator n=1 Tax=Streptomyces sp. SYP-A7185 TaxID=3040076 RepID=UPI0038F7D94F
MNAQSGHDVIAVDTRRPGPEHASLTTGAVARKLGVAPGTLRTWERRYGIGPSRREEGRHRRWRPEDISRLERMCHLTGQGVPPAEAARIATSPDDGRGGGPEAPDRARHRRAPGGYRSLPLGEVWTETRGLAKAALRLDGPTVHELLTSAVREHGVVVAWESIIAPTLHAVGRKWSESGERYVEVEHFLSWHVSTTLRTTAPAPARTTAPPVLLACMPDEQHTLPLEALGAALAEAGVPALMFGAAVPAGALEAAVRRLGPCAVVLWAQSPQTADIRLVRDIIAIEWGIRGARSHPLVLLGGPGWSHARPEAQTMRLTGLASTMAFLRTTLPAAAPVELRHTDAG